LTRIDHIESIGILAESTKAHVFIVSLLVVDLIATAVDILKTIHNKSLDLNSCVALAEECACVDHFQRSEEWEITYWISITILVILLLNVFGLLVSFGISFFFHPGYILDLVVVATALLLEVLLDAETAGLYDQSIPEQGQLSMQMNSASEEVA
jgi:hypothetical protein